MIRDMKAEVKRWREAVEKDAFIHGFEAGKNHVDLNLWSGEEAWEAYINGQLTQ